jgi:5-methylcytosine-specific restriction endonuclease McrA
MSSKTLLLNSWYVPTKIIPWESAIRLMYLNKADVMAEYKEEIRSPSISMKMPAVIRIRRDTNKRKNGIKFSRINVYTRDKFCCQYCSVKFPMSKLTYDHMIPRAQGGRTSWDNIVTSCKDCNTIKGNRTPDEWGIYPLNEPVKPKSLPNASPILEMENIPEEWNGFCSNNLVGI